MNIVNNQNCLGGGFVYLEKDKRPSSAAFSTENRRKQNIKDMIQKSSAGNTQKEKFDMQVRYPGQEFDSNYTFQEESKNALNQKAGNNARQRFQSEMSFNQNNFQASQDSPTNLSPQERTRKAASTQAINYESEGRSHQLQAASEKEKQERRMVLTEQLLSLQSQGFFKNLPKKEVISSYEGGLSELAPRSGMSFPHSQVSQDNAIDQITSYLTKNFEHLQKSQGLSQYDLTNAISQAIDSLNNLPEQDTLDRQREQTRQGIDPYNKGTRARQENQSQRAQKDFVIRHSKVSNPSTRNIGAENVFQGSSLQYQARNREDEDIDLEDTVPYGGIEQLRNYRPQGREEIHQVVNKDTTQPLTRMWNEALKDYERNDFEGAYEKILDSGSS